VSRDSGNSENSDLNGDRDSLRELRWSSRRIAPEGRRSTDVNPRADFTKKFLVVTIAVVNALYLASEAFLTAINAC